MSVLLLLSYGRWACANHWQNDRANCTCVYGVCRCHAGSDPTEQKLDIILNVPAIFPNSLSFIERPPLSNLIA